MEDRKARLAALAAKTGRATATATTDATANDGGEAVAAAVAKASDRELANRPPGHESEQGQPDPADDSVPTSRTLKFRNYTLAAGSGIGGGGGADAEHRPVLPSAKRSATAALDRPEGSTGVTIAEGEPKRSRRTEPQSALEAALEKASREAQASSTQRHLPPDVGPEALVAAGDGAGGAVVPAAVPRNKVNWDLKRDVQSKLLKLERRTQKILVELLREKLERDASKELGEATAPELAGATGAGADADDLD